MVLNVLAGIGAVAAIALVGLLIQDAKEWEAFKQEHNCAVTVKVPSTSAITVVAGQVGTTIIPGYTTYHCDDGKNYTR